MALLQLQKDCGYGKTVAMAQLQHITTAAMVQLWPWQDGGYAAMASLQPWHDCGHGTTVAAAQQTVAMARLQQQHDCEHGKTVAMAQLQPQYHYSHGTAPCGMGTIT